MGRLISMVFEYDGQILAVNENGEVQPKEPAPDEHGIQYADDGYSVEKQHGCVRNKMVDEYVALMETGDEFQRKVAASFPRWFAIFVEGREYTDEERDLLMKNYQQQNGNWAFSSGWLGSMVFRGFWANVYRDPNDKVAPYKYIYDNLLEGFCTPIFGFDPYVHSATFPMKALRHFDKLVEYEHNKAQTPGYEKPTVSPK